MDNRILDKWIEVARNKIGAKRKQPSYGRTGSTLSLPKKPRSALTPEMKLKIKTLEKQLRARKSKSKRSVR